MPWAAVIGSPIKHSLSPQLHRAAWRSLGLGEGWRYERYETSVEALPQLVNSIDADCLGLSVTMPCKQAIIPLLDIVDPMAAAVGSVNTLIPSQGLLTGFNTDVHGIVSAIREARSRRGLCEARRATILGAGATTASALAALGELGITSSTIAARRFAGPGSILAAASRLGVEIHQIMWADEDAIAESIEASDIVISTLPVGVADELAKRVKIKESQTLLDVVYAPRETGLVRAWNRSGGVIAWGLDMLVHQAHQQVRLMTGRDPDLAAMKAAVRQCS